MNTETLIHIATFMIWVSGFGIGFVVAWALLRR